VSIADSSWLRDLLSQSRPGPGAAAGDGELDRAGRELYFQKLTFVEKVIRRIPDAAVGCRKNGDVMIPLYPE
jgi:hypothetical protein